MHIFSCKYTSFLFTLHGWCWCVLFKDIYLYSMSVLESQSTLENLILRYGYIGYIHIYWGIRYAHYFVLSVLRQAVNKFVCAFYESILSTFICPTSFFTKLMLGVNYLHLTLLLYTYSHECPLAWIIEKFVLEETGIKGLSFGSTSSQHNRAQHIHRQFSSNRQHAVEKHIIANIP